MNYMINKNKYDCCGCTACMYACPRNCISMKEDKEGFWYPSIDLSFCINCHLCEKVCPFNKDIPAKESIKIFAAKNLDDGVRMHSSSGGIFSLLAEKVIRQGGIVYGAMFGDSWEVKHGYVDSLEEMSLLRGSKYVQSHMEECFKSIKENLKNKLVLFSGTPCQVLGLKLFLGKEYANLLTVDFVCHGVPSPKVWRKYLEETIAYWSEGKKSVSSHLDSEKKVIEKIEFRSKLTGWKKYSFAITLSEMTTDGEKKSVLLSSIFYENSYMQAFLSDLSLRPSCYQCKCKNGRSKSDLTIADFWGADQYLPEMDDDKGISTLIINSQRGNDFLVDIKTRMEMIDINLMSGMIKNGGYKEMVSIPKKRTLFFYLINDKKYTVEHATRRCLEGTHVRRTLRVVKKTILNFFIKSN